MSWLDWMRRRRADRAEAALTAVQRQFESFVTLLERNNRVLRVMSELEERFQGRRFFDFDDIRAGVDEVRQSVSTIVDAMIAVGGDRYTALRNVLDALDSDLELALTGCPRPEPGRLIVHLDEIDRTKACDVGCKNARLGELRVGLGLPVPDGFAITSWAYRRYLGESGLQDRLDRRLAGLDPADPEGLVRASAEIQDLVLATPLPDDLASAIREAVDVLRERSGGSRFALRSSAIGEDTHLTFAGQYRSLLNVPAEDVVDRYREVVAGKFTPKALFYLLSHGLRDSDLPMGVGCIDMVDAAASGVVYTRHPVEAEEDCIVVHAILGLGKYLVDGTLTPDVFSVSRDGTVRDARIARKPVRLVLDDGAGTIEEPVPEAEQDAPSLDEAHLRRLAEFAVRLEERFGTPQDIEWALDRDGRLLLLQTRPLEALRVRSPSEEPEVDGIPVVLAGGTTVCPGAASGPVHHATSIHDLPDVPAGSILVAPHPFPGLVAAMERVVGLVTEVGAVASHMATLAREYRIPTLMGLRGAGGIAAGRVVTLDATGTTIYEGERPALVDARRPEFRHAANTGVFGLLRRVLDVLSPLHLLHPADPGFTVEGCRSYHDVVRFCHQKALDEMFAGAAAVEDKQEVSVRLKTALPLDVHFLYLDKAPERSWVHEDEIRSAPMRALWDGIRQEGWPTRPAAPGFTAISSAIGAQALQDGPAFSESSYAFLSSEYMILGLRLGYHLSTFEAMCTENPDKNFIRVQHKEGGASYDRQVRRARLLSDILKRLGFACSYRGDFLDARTAYLDRASVLRTLHLLGRITMKTKQLDMALSNDEITTWYTQDILQNLGLDGERGEDG